MPGATPEETFAEARDAMGRGDWEGVFACLDAGDLVKIANNGIARFLMATGPAAEAFTHLCAEQGIPQETLGAVRAALQRSAESSQAVLATTDPAGMMEASRRHHQNVLAHQNAVRDLVKSAPDMSRFTAALERALRADGGGGSVSAKLFVGETIGDVSVEGTKAWAVRRVSPGHTEDVGFVRRKGGWYLRLFAKRP
jgi:hypothetical protein